MDDETFDAIVIGGGSGGLSFARSAAELGARVALIERGALGGTCVNRGCVPKKMLWAVARAMRDVAGLSETGILSDPPRLDLARLADLRAGKISDIVESYGGKLDEAGIVRIEGTARLAAGSGITVAGRRVKAAQIVLATGGRPARPGFEGAEICDVSDDVFGWRVLPERLAVVGGGYIGCEFAAIHAAFGSQVTLISDVEAVLTEFSAPARKVAADNLRAQGVRLELGHTPARAARDGDGIRLSLDDGREMVFDRVLLATGRDTNLDVLGERRGEIEITNAGQIATDGNLSTSAPGVHAIGDCADRLPLTPVAIDDGRVLAQLLFGDGSARPVDLDRVATTAFVLPPVAEAGRRDTIAHSEKSTPLENTVLGGDACDFWAYGDEKGQLSAVSLIGDGVHEGIGFAAQLIAAGHRPDAFDRALPIHPTMTEGLLTDPYT